jgi:tetratricopeptide (TPR) repeat protein
MTKAVKSETSESFAVNYYSSNPIDTRPPQEKLSDVESKLSEGAADDDEKFTLLVQKKTLSEMIFGETSPEAIRATTELGAFYNEHNKPDSASRNLSKASQNAKQTELQAEDAFTLAVELSDANLNASSPSKADKTKQVAVADLELSRFAEYESANGMNSFRRDLYLARIRSYRTKWEESLAFYEKALATYQSVHPEEKKPEGDDQPPPEGGERQEKLPEEANIYVEAAEVAERVQEDAKAGQYYQKAYDLYKRMGFDEDAAKIEEKIRKSDADEAPQTQTEPPPPQDAVYDHQQDDDGGDGPDQGDPAPDE